MNIKSKAILPLILLILCIVTACLIFFNNEQIPSPEGRAPKFNAANSHENNKRRTVMKSTGIMPSLPSIKSDRKLLNNVGVIDAALLSSLGLNEEQIEKTSKAISDELSAVGVELSNRLSKDPRKNIFYGEGVEAYYIASDAGGSIASQNRLHQKIAQICGKDISLIIEKSLMASRPLAMLGNSDVYIQRVKGNNSGNAEMQIQFFDPKTGNFCSSFSTDNKDELRNAIGQATYEKITSN